MLTREIDLIVGPSPLGQNRAAARAQMTRNIIQQPIERSERARSDDIRTAWACVLYTLDDDAGAEAQLPRRRPQEGRLTAIGFDHRQLVLKAQVATQQPDGDPGQAAPGP